MTGDLRRTNRAGRFGEPKIRVVTRIPGEGSFRTMIVSNHSKEALGKPYSPILPRVNMND